MYCKNCGKEISADSKFCENCGYSFKTEGKEEEKFNKEGDTNLYKYVVPYNKGKEDKEFKKEGNFYILGYISAIVSLIFFPIIFGPIGIMVGIVSTLIKEKQGKNVIITSFICMIIGMILGMMAWSGR